MYRVYYVSGFPTPLDPLARWKFGIVIAQSVIDARVQVIKAIAAHGLDVDAALHGSRVVIQEWPTDEARVLLQFT